MTVEHLSQAWLDQQQALAAELPERPGATSRILHVVTGAPGGEVRYRTTWVDGRMTEAALGDDADARLTFLQAHADAQQVARGEVPVEVAFMQGRLKVTGDMGEVMALMPLLTSDEYRSLVTQLGGQTAF